jgi:hypothetical protein
MQKGNTDVVGQSCTVTSGPNKGKKGTYTRDDDGNLWCEGDWGGTECDGGKCKDAAAKVSVFEFLDDTGQLVYQVEGLVENDRGNIFHVTATIDAASGESRAVAALPIAATPLSELRKSKSKLEQTVGNAIRSKLE